MFDRIVLTFIHSFVHSFIHSFISFHFCFLLTPIACLPVQVVILMLGKSSGKSMRKVLWP